MVRLTQLCVAVGFFAFIASTAAAAAQEAGIPDLSSACPGAAAWNAAHEDQLPEAMKVRDAARTLGNPDLRHDLEERVAVDQIAREALLAHRGNHRDVARIDDENGAWLAKLLKTESFPKAGQVGEYGLHLLWLLVQHADERPKLQELALDAFRQRYNEGEFSGDDLARLADRVLLHAGKPQRFGTQFDWMAETFHPKPMEDPEKVAANRLKIGVMPLEDYACLKNEELKLLRR